MAHLASLGSHAINGVAALHTELLKTNVLSDFYALTPEKFSNKTNGVTPRRWMVLSNPELAQLLTARLGSGWVRDMERLRRLEPLIDDAEFCQEWRDIKRHNKLRLSAFIQDRLGITTDPDSISDLRDCDGLNLSLTTRSFARNGETSSGTTSCGFLHSFRTGWELLPIRIPSPI